MSAQPVPETTEAPRVVLVTSETEWSRALTAAVKRAGFEARMVLSAESATLAATHRPPAVFVLDAACLAAGGLRVMEALRMAAPGTPILVLADSADSQVRLKSLLLGADDCIARPCSHQEAVVRIRRAAERRNGLRRLEAENLAHRERSLSLRGELGELRDTLRRNVGRLQQAMEFHGRLDPAAGLDAVAAEFLRNLSALTGLDRTAYLGPGYGEDSTWFTIRAARGVGDVLVDSLRLPRGGRLASHLRAGNLPLVLDRVGPLPGVALELGILSTGGFTTAVPVVSRGRLLGITLLGEDRAGGPPAEDTREVVRFLAAALAPALAALDDRRRSDRRHTRVLAALVESLETRDPYLRGHSQRVALLAEDLGRRMSLTDGELVGLASAAVLHDVGRFEVDAALWGKTTPLTDADWDEIRRHPAEGARLAADTDWPEGVCAAIRHHHERWDGAGYPDRLRGEAIPLPARILAVADTFEALTSPRAYRAANPAPHAFAALQDEAGSALDPALVELVLAEPGRWLLP